MDFKVYSYKDIKNEIKYKGYMTGTQISIKITNPKEIKEVLRELDKDPEIHKIKYTNKYIASFITKQLYFYNPNIKKRTKKKVSRKTNTQKEINHDLLPKCKQ